MSVSDRTFQRVALEDPNGQWELHCGSLRRKPAMSADHNRAAMYLAAQLLNQLDRSQFEVRLNMGHVHRSPQSYYIPDVCVIPSELVRPLLGLHVLEAYEAPLPLVIEIWSPSSGDYDVEVKLQEYQRRGDLEIWRIHPYERSLTSWRRQPDGGYSEALQTGGTIRPAALPGVTIDLGAVFA